MTTEPYSESDIDRILDETFVKEIELSRELPSTNDRALKLCRDDQLQTPFLVLTERQTAGRGRGANRWWSDSGALTFSLILNARKWSPLPERPSLISLTAGLAVCETLKQLVPAADVGLKWPNDVWLNGRKVCGILAEMPAVNARTLVLGIGVNVNNRLSAAPDALQPKATSLIDVTGRQHDLADLLVRLLKQLDSEREQAGMSDPQSYRRWQTFCVLSGRTVSVQTGSQSIVGFCRGIDEEGALLLQTATGLNRCLSGTVTGIE